MTSCRPPGARPVRTHAEIPPPFRQSQTLDELVAIAVYDAVHSWMDANYDDILAAITAASRPVLKVVRDDGDES